MDLPMLFRYQSQLNRRIIEQRGLEENLLDTQLLALLVEIAELAQAWRGFKVWKKDRSPRRPEMLEEYVDGLHFFASTGLMMGVAPEAVKIRAALMENTITQFLGLFQKTSSMESPGDWERAFRLFLGLGEMLGLSDKEIKQSYLQKHEINYRRLREDHVYQ